LEVAAVLCSRFELERADEDVKCGERAARVEVEENCRAKGRVWDLRARTALLDGLIDSMTVTARERYGEGKGRREGRREGRGGEEERRESEEKEGDWVQD
jgi:hypothetical protein